VVVLLVWQALRGEPVTRPGATTLTAAGVLLLGLLAGVGTAVLGPGLARWPPRRPRVDHGDGR
jgi:hypothetical protein